MVKLNLSEVAANSNVSMTKLRHRGSVLSSYVYSPKREGFSSIFTYSYSLKGEGVGEKFTFPETNFLYKRDYSKKCSLLLIWREGV